MILQSISVLNYKNLEQAELTFSPNVNCIVGANGVGKTNLLDAIGYLSLCRSAQGGSDSINIRHGADFFMISGQYVSELGEARSVTCSLQRGCRKRVKVDGKDLKKISEHVGNIPLVLISPSDSELISGGSEERRKFMDQVIAQYDAPYLEALIRYERCLKQRNALLKQEEEPDASVLDVLEMMMSRDAAIIYAARRVFAEEFRPIFQKMYATLSRQEVEDVEIEYQSHGERGDLEPILHDWRARERLVGYTLHGTHKDDLLLSLKGYPVRREGSQGQTKTYFIAMKLAQFLYLKQKGHCHTPLLLLDDIFDKLDDSRVGNIIDYVSGDDFGQIFITDTQREHLDKILAATQRDYRLFHINADQTVWNDENLKK